MSIRKTITQCVYQKSFEIDRIIFQNSPNLTGVHIVVPIAAGLERILSCKYVHSKDNYPMSVSEVIRNGSVKFQNSPNLTGVHIVVPISAGLERIRSSKYIHSKDNYPMRLSEAIRNR